MRGIIIAGGIIENPQFIEGFLNETDYIICLDSGLHYAHWAGITPSLIAGDFDSVSPSILKKYSNNSYEIMKFPREKDYTDMEIGIKAAASRGAEELLIFGGLGGRYDHALGNIDNMLLALQMGMAPVIIDERQHIFLLNKGRKFFYKKDTVISLLPFTPIVDKVETINLYYPLKKENLNRGYSRGISNAFLGDYCEINFESGILLVIINIV